MKKTTNIIVAAITCLIWLYYFYKFPHIGNFARIACLVILVPMTARDIYSFLLERSRNKQMEERDDLAENYTPFSPANAASTRSATCFCPECGTENQKGAKFCVQCGKPLDQ